jgi:polyisoprenoid-binding protein YceI
VLRWRVVLLSGVVGAVLAPSAAVAPAVAFGQSVAQPLGPDGSWIVKSSASIVGFRAREKYLRLPVPSEVVGRTSVITGTMTIGRSAILATAIVVDMRTLKTGDSQRDETLRTSRGPKWNDYPRGTFKLQQPILLGRLQPGTIKKVGAKGVLQLHGVSRVVLYPLEVRWEGSTFEAAGRLRTRMTAFGFDPPSVAGFTTVSNAFTIEVKLTFVRPE